MESGLFRSEFDSHWYMADELFGNRPYDELEETLYKVEELTLKESAIAEHMDLSHAEKIAEIKPLRKKRHDAVLSRGARPYKSTKVEREYEARREERIAAAVTEAMTISDEDRSWASLLKIKLD